MSNFIHECFSVFGLFVNWAFTTQSGLGVSIGGLLIGINALALIIYYVFSRYK